MRGEVMSTYSRHDRLNPVMTIGEQIVKYFTFKKYASKAEVDGRDEILRRVGLPERKNEYPPVLWRHERRGDRNCTRL